MLRHVLSTVCLAALNLQRRAIPASRRGPEKSVAIDVNGEAESVTLTGNQLRETRQPASRIGIRGAETRDIRCVDNRIEGFATPISDQRKR